MKTINLEDHNLDISTSEARVIDYLARYSLAGLDQFQTGSGRHRSTDLPLSASRLQELGIIYHHKARPQSEQAREYFTENPRRQFVVGASPKLLAVAKLLNEDS